MAGASYLVPYLRCRLQPLLRSRPDISSLEAYVDAIKQPKVPDQIASMEHFLEVSGQSNLRLDALEILVMDYQHENNSEKGGGPGT